MTVVTFTGAMSYTPAINNGVVLSSITAEAAETKLRVPAVSKGNVYSNKLEIKIDNLSKFTDKAKFEVYVNGKYLKTVSASTLKEKGNRISICQTADNYIKAGTVYTIKVRTVYKEKKSTFKTVKIKSSAKTYYKIRKSAPLYKLSNGKMKKVARTQSAQYVVGVLSSSSGVRVGGKSVKKYNDKYVLINQGQYKGYYTLSDKKYLARISERTAKINKVVSYAASMNGGSYVWGGESYRATDCSGLTKLAYKQIGVDLAHSTYSQANAGRASSMSNIKAGDIIICNNYGHAALYIGNGKIVHAMSPSYGIRIQPVSNISYCGAVNAVRTII